jgi:hypothetical protein
MYGAEGGGGAPDDHPLPAGGAKPARKVAKAALSALATALREREFPGTEPGDTHSPRPEISTELRSAIAAALPFALGKPHAVAAAVPEALGNLPEVYVLSSAFAEAVKALTSRKRQQKKGKPHSPESRSTKDAGNRGNTEAEEQGLELPSAQEVASALQESLARAVATDATGTDAYAVVDSVDDKKVKTVSVTIRTSCHCAGVDDADVR